jgi:hypothetical protein
VRISGVRVVVCSGHTAVCQNGWCMHNNGHVINCISQDITFEGIRQQWAGLFEAIAQVEQGDALQPHSLYIHSYTWPRRG